MVKIFLSLILSLCLESSIARAVDLSEHSASPKPASLSERLSMEKNQITILSPHYQLSIPQKFIHLAEVIEPIVKSSYRELGKYVDIKGYKPEILIIPEERFYEITKLPKWTSAIFFRGQIVIVATSDMKELNSSLRHEMMHGALYYLTGGNPPAGWLDEGLAQIFEELDERHLSEYVKDCELPKLSSLTGGFTQLPEEMVPRAYGVSYFAAKKFLRHYGKKGLTEMLKLLHKGEQTGSSNVMAQRSFEHIFKKVTSLEVDNFYR